jgi:hypothetical protein
MISAVWCGLKNTPFGARKVEREKIEEERNLDVVITHLNTKSAVRVEV